MSVATVRARAPAPVTALATALAAALAFAVLAPTPARAAEPPPSAATLVTRGPATLLGSALGAIAVVTPAGEPLGDVSDAILSHDGRVVALVVGVGGFLGLAEKPVAIAYERLSVRAVEGGVEFVCDLDRAALEAAPRYRERGD